jgi:hypothetical protein
LSALLALPGLLLLYVLNQRLGGPRLKRDAV